VLDTDRKGLEGSVPKMGKTAGLWSTFSSKLPLG
jgi:hypothetical protein